MTDPYQTPTSTLTPESTDEHPLASRWARLGAVLIDGIIGLLITIPFFMMTGMWSEMASGAEPAYGMTLLGGLYGFVGYIIVHYYFLDRNGQTVGKKVLGIRIEDPQGRLIGAPAIIGKRYLPVTAASLIPLIGGLLVIIDALFIFRKDKRCIHDMIAGTRVVKLSGS